MSSQTYKTVRAQIVPEEVNQSTVYILDAVNPETVIAKELRLFFETMGYSEIFPNFDRIRIGTVHPFSILLAQEVLEQPRSTNMFPSITVADSNTTEDSPTLGNEYASVVFNAQDIATLDGYRQAKDLFISDTGWAKIQEAISITGQVVGIKHTYTTRNSININIWSDNKDITSFIFDMVGHFLIQKKIDMHRQYDIDFGAISGQRTGDINLDFGMLLYGSNIEVPVQMDHTAVKFDIASGVISEVDVSTLPEFIVGG